MHGSLGVIDSLTFVLLVWRFTNVRSQRYFSTVCTTRSAKNLQLYLGRQNNSKGTLFGVLG